MKRALLTGATGFIGRQAIAGLRRRDYEVHAVSRNPLRAEPGLVWHEADLLRGGASAALIAAVRPTHLLHLAWFAAPGKFWTARENFSWVRASLELLEAFSAANGERAVMAGSCAEYDWSAGTCIEGVTPLAPATVYGTCKHALQTMLGAFSGQFGLSSAWGRIFFLFGPHEHPSRLVASVVRALLTGEPALCSSGEQVRDFMYVGEVADAFAALLDSPVQGPVNIASGQPLAVRDLVLRIGGKLGRTDLLRLGARPGQPGEPPILAADVRRLFEEVGWQPSTNLDAGLDLTIRWWRDNLA